VNTPAWPPPLSVRSRAGAGLSQRLGAFGPPALHLLPKGRESWAQGRPCRPERDSARQDMPRGQPPGHGRKDHAFCAEPVYAETSGRGFTIPAPPLTLGGGTPERDMPRGQPPGRGRRGHALCRSAYRPGTTLSVPYAVRRPRRARGAPARLRTRSGGASGPERLPQAGSAYPQPEPQPPAAAGAASPASPATPSLA
jgi:hypothetical protein